MALNIKDPEADRLAGEVAALTGESKTRAVRVALEERRERLLSDAPVLARRTALDRLLREEIWPQLAPEGPTEPLTRDEREAILGYGPDGA